MRDQNLSKEAPAVIRTSPRRTSANTNQTLAVPGTGDNRVPQMHDTADCVGNNVGPTSQAVRDDGALNTTAAAKVESSAALEISEGQKQMQSRKPTIQFGEHTVSNFKLSIFENVTTAIQFFEANFPAFSVSKS